MEKNDCDAGIAGLQQENEALSQQVKRLIKAEGKLYQYQEQLDTQLKEYKDLYELNKELNTTFDIGKIYQYAVAYATRNLEYERAVLFERAADTGGYHVRAVDGYYNKRERSSVGALVIGQDDPFLSPLFAGVEYLICKADAEEKELVRYRAKLRMNEYFMCRLGAPPSPVAFLSVGNSAENAQFYRKVDDSHGALLSIGNLVGLISSSMERNRAEETIKYQAYHDLLTGLPNRALFADLLTHEIPQMQRTQKRLAVLFLDIDYFKNINESLGHAAGDTLIQEVAVRLKTGISLNTVARTGGDKFTILLPLIAHPEDAAGTAEEVRDTFKKPFVIDNYKFYITASIGISLYPDDGGDAETLLKNADIAMYHAKDQGRNNYQFFNPALNVRTFERIMLENRLRQAVEREELVVYYQPQQNISTKEIIGAEALVRWRHPELGLLSPLQFIPIAEETGLVVQIDQWVLRSACAQLRAWQKAGHPLRYVTVNLSSRQFQQPDLAETVAKALEESGLSPESIGVEITETIAMQNTELTARNLNRLNAMGIRFSIDDFGTGYSSLSYLKKLPIHKLKIDKSFIMYLIRDPDYQAIVNAVIAMAHILKLKVVAEGVETEDQMSFLHSNACDEMQGYLCSRPIPAEEFEELLIERS